MHRRSASSRIQEDLNFDLRMKPPLPDEKSLLRKIDERPRRRSPSPLPYERSVGSTKADGTGRLWAVFGFIVTVFVIEHCSVCKVKLTLYFRRHSFTWLRLRNDRPLQGHE